MSRTFKKLLVTKTKCEVRMSQRGTHDLNPVRPTLVFLFFWKRIFLPRQNIPVHVSLSNRFHPTTHIPYCFKIDMFLHGLALHLFTISLRSNQWLFDFEQYQNSSSLLAQQVILSTPRGYSLYYGLYGRLRPKVVPFLAFRYMKGWRFHRVEVYERVGRSVMYFGLHNDLKGLQKDLFYGHEKVAKIFLFCDFLVPY